MNPLLQIVIARKAALAAALACLLAITAVVRLAWQELSYLCLAPSTGVTLASNTPCRQPLMLSPLALMQSTNSIITLTNMPFNAAAVDNYRARLAADELAAEAARKAAIEEERRAAAERAAQLARDKAAAQALARDAARQAASLKATAVHVTKPATPPPTISIVYQGLFQLAGEQPLALICVETNVGTYAIGESCRGAVLTRITADAVSLTLADGSMRLVESGRPELIRKDELHAQLP